MHSTHDTMPPSAAPSTVRSPDTQRDCRLHALITAYDTAYRSAHQARISWGEEWFLLVALRELRLAHDSGDVERLREMAAAWGAP